MSASPSVNASSLVDAFVPAVLRYGSLRASGAGASGSAHVVVLGRRELLSSPAVFGLLPNRIDKALAAALIKQGGVAPLYYERGMGCGVRGVACSREMCCQM